MYDSYILNDIINLIKKNILGMHVQKLYSSSNKEYSIKFSSNKYIKINLFGDKSYINYLENKSTLETEESTMLIYLKKILQGSKLTDIQQLNFDRIVMLEFLGKNDVFDKQIYKIYLELMGRHSNLIVTDEKDFILQALKYTPREIDSERAILYKNKYIIPTDNKINPLQSTQVYNSLEYNNIKGFHKKLNDIIIDNKLENNSLKEISNFIINSKKYYIHIKNNNIYDFYKLKNSNYENIEYPNISNMIESYYIDSSIKNKFNSQRQNYIKLLNIKLKSLKSKLKKLDNELYKANNADEFKIKAELLQAYQYELNNHKSSITVLNYYNNEEIKIKIDTNKSIIQNSNIYYKKFNKLTASKRKKIEQIEITKEQIEHIDKLIYDLNTIENSAELYEVVEELTKYNFINKSKKKMSNKKSLPHKFIVNDTTILVGKNNKQNDKLTFKTKIKDYIWLHAKDIPGSHTIIFKKYDEIDEDTLIKAAKLAAYYSKAKGSNNVPVDYCKLKDVKKKAGAKPGFVNYFNQKTVYVKPTEYILLKENEQS